MQALREGVGGSEECTAKQPHRFGGFGLLLSFSFFGKICWLHNSGNRRQVRKGLRSEVHRLFWQPWATYGPVVQWGHLCDSSKKARWMEFARLSRWREGSTRKNSAPMEELSPKDWAAEPFPVSQGEGSPFGNISIVDPQATQTLMIAGNTRQRTRDPRLLDVPDRNSYWALTCQFMLFCRLGGIWAYMDSP